MTGMSNNSIELAKSVFIKSKLIQGYYIKNITREMHNTSDNITTES